MTLPAHLPLEEALAYFQTRGVLPHTTIFRESREAVPIAGFSDYVLGQCPVRDSPSFWLIDGEGKFWTSSMWHNKGEIAECWNTNKNIIIEWPEMDGIDFTPLLHILMRFGSEWEREGHHLVLAEFDETCVALWPDVDREFVYTLMIYRFDQEWGIGAFQHSVQAAKFKHRRSITRNRRKQRMLSY